MRRAGFVVLVVAGLLAGCASMVQPAGAPNRAAWHARQKRLIRLDNWHLQGRIGVITSRRGGSASFDWRQQGAHITLFFSGPFGLGAVKLWGTASEMHVKDARGRTWVSYAPQQALASTLGWPLPVGSLRYWVLGLPAPGVDRELEIGAHGLLRGLQQQGWSVRYGAYLHHAGWLLPQRLLLVRGTTRIKLIVSQWTLEPIL